MEILETGSQRMAVIPLESKFLQSNTILMTGEVTPESCNNWIQQLLYLGSILSKDDKITVIINSPGGSVYDGLGVFDAMQNVKNRGIVVSTMVMGVAWSMGAILLMGGTEGERYATPNASVLIHEISHWTEGKTPMIMDDLEEMKRMQQKLDGIIGEYSNPKLVEMCNRKDLWLTAEQAVDWNIVDFIKK